MTARLKNPLSCDWLRADCGLTGSRRETVVGKRKGFGGKLGYFQFGGICFSDIDMCNIFWNDMRKSVLFFLRLFFLV